MPRIPDVGWQYGMMVSGNRHHIKCNYCQMIMIGGITRFKKHLAGEGGEIKGCDAVPDDVKALIQRHLDAWEPRTYTTKKKRAEGLYAVPFSGNMESDASDPDASPETGAREFFDAFGSSQGKPEHKSVDPGWAHGMSVKGDKRKVVCRYCHKLIQGGGITRLKQHLAGQRGISSCDRVPDNVKLQMQRYLETGKLEPPENGVGNYSIIEYNDETPIDPCFEGSLKNRAIDVGNSRKRMKFDVSYDQQVLTVSKLTSLPLLTSQETIDQADSAVAKFIYENGISFDVANSLYFQRMADAIAAVGPGYKMPTFQALRGTLLNNCTEEIEEFSNDLRKSWEVTGCTVLVDGRNDKAGRSIINFFVYCPKGTLFLKSVDASDIGTSVEALAALFESVIQDVGLKNIVHFVADNDPWYEDAGKRLIEKYKTFFWSVSASHYIDVMLKGLSEMDEVKWVMLKAKKVCQTIYNNQWVLDLFKKIAQGKDLIHLARTKSLTDFLTIRNFISLKQCLLQTFNSSSWEQSGSLIQKLGMDVNEILSDMQFWLSCTNIMKVSEPLVTVSNLADSGEQPSIGYIYDAIEKAKKEIILAFNEEEYEYLPYFNLINQTRDELHSPLHAAAHYLNPSMYYNNTFSLNNVIERGLLDCVRFLEPDHIAQNNIMKQKAFYESAVGDFSRPLAIRGRESLPPAIWWSSYASEYPDLQRFAIRILSQTCSITPFMKISNMNEDIHSTKNKLERERLNKLSFIHYNLHMQQRQPSGKISKVPTAEYDPLALHDENGEEWIRDPGEAEVKDVGIKLVDIFGPSASIPPVDIFCASHTNLGN